MFLFNNFIYLFMAVLGPHCCADVSLVPVCGLLIAVTSLAVEHRGHTDFVSCGMQAQQLRLLDSGAEAEQLRCMGLVTPRPVGSPYIRD